MQAPRVRLLALACFLTAALVVQADTPALLTVAEKSDYKATSRQADVQSFCERLAQQSKLVKLAELGTTNEGRKLPMLILADPPISAPEAAAKREKPVVLVIANIHAGEVDGKEAVLMLARDLTSGKEAELLKKLTVVIVPNFNADGNEKIDKANRRYQPGPEGGVGIRANAQGFDLNRDFVKLESPEVRALVKAFRQWAPAVFVDCHTTNGAYHRYTITYEGGRTPAGDKRLTEFVRDTMLPEITRRMEKQNGYHSYFYGLFSSDRSRWETVPATPRYSIHYAALRNRIGILSESYVYASFKERVLGSKAFVTQILHFTAENAGTIQKQLSEARTAAAKAETVVLRHKAAPLPERHNLLGFVEEMKDGRRVRTDKPKEYPVQYMGAAEPTLTVKLPKAYLLPASYTKVVENLQRHGVEVEELREDIDITLEVYRVDKVTKAAAFQKHQPVTVEATPHPETRRVEAGTVVVKTAQPLGVFAAYLLEPQSEDGLVTWNFFDDALAEGKDYPVLRLPAVVPMMTGRVRPLKEERTFGKRVPPASDEGGGRGTGFIGSPVSGLTWLDDGEHYLQIRDGKLMKVHARSGRSSPFFDPAKLEQALAKLPGVGKETARSWSRQTSFQWNPKKTGALFEQGGDLYYAAFDGSEALRLTKSKGRKELTSFSPDGRHVAFVRDQNLFVVDLDTQTEKTLTKDGGGLISNGKADWVYFEEIFNRSYRSYWWAPDSRHIVFTRYDDTPVNKYTVIDQVPVRQTVEATPYPKAGDPNPVVKIGIVPAADGDVAWADLSEYPAKDMLVIRAGFTPDGEHVYLYVQDRAQTWLDVCTVPTTGGKPTRLFRETTKAWVEDHGPLHFLKDGSFLFSSERTGWRHLYHYDRAGEYKGAVTGSDWEVHTLHDVDEEGGWVYISGTRDSPIANNLYRVRLNGEHLQRLTQEPGDHRVTLSPKSNLYLDSYSSHTTPTRVRLSAADGAPVRMIDTNPVYALEEYTLGKYELVQIKLPDGFVLEGSLLTPVDLDPKRKYPVWFKTYAGPHAPTIHDAWSGGNMQDQALASAGYVVFKTDPRSASGKGAQSTWTAYKQLGVQEMKDIEAAIRWLITTYPFVDANRIGMSGHSYGGFMTAYCLTHSKLFAAGIAGAPVTDWKNYDSIYTERYMDTPQKNAKGYEATSVVKAAGNLHGRLLLLHGIMDDNVHMANSVQLIGALQSANKDFDVMFYPRARHGIFGRHYQRLMLDFMKKHLRPEPSGSPAEAVPAKAAGG